MKRRFRRRQINNNNIDGRMLQDSSLISSWSYRLFSSALVPLPFRSSGHERQKEREATSERSDSVTSAPARTHKPRGGPISKRERRLHNRSREEQGTHPNSYCFFSLPTRIHFIVPQQNGTKAQTIYFSPSLGGFPLNLPPARERHIRKWAEKEEREREKKNTK